VGWSIPSWAGASLRGEHLSHGLQYPLWAGASLHGLEHPLMGSSHTHPWAVGPEMLDEAPH